MGALILLGQAPMRDPVGKEQLELVQGGGGGAARFLELVSDPTGPGRKIGSGHRQRIYCLIDKYASLFSMTRPKSTAGPPVTYQRLRQKLSKISWIALGSLVERNKPGQGGPRYQWSRRVGTKTVTVALSAEQFAWLKQAISNQRQVWDILMQLQQLTARHALENLPGPPRRKHLSKKRLG